MLVQSGQMESAASLLATRPVVATTPFDPRKWINLQLAVARGADAENAVRIAERADDGFAGGAPVSQMSFPIRDDYTSLTWLGGTQALWILHDPVRAATLFYRYGAAGRTPQTRAKGFYWAGRALAQAGQSESAQRYFVSAAAFPDQFYGMLALERLGRPLPSLVDPAHPMPTPAQRAAFYARPITQAVREVSRNADWQTTIRFFREISAQALTETDRTLVAELARYLGRRDLGVVLGQAAGDDQVPTFRDVSFPLIPTPPGTDWTMVHAITRQESQFSQNAISHSGARGLMQLMPGTAQSEAKRLGVVYSFSGLTSDPAYNMELGDGAFSHLMTVYGGCYPLAIAAYNSGAGNVNRWLRDNGDPRLGAVSWVDWIEQIPFSETRNYVAHVIENAVVYEALYPVHARYRGANPVSYFLTKRTPG
jgi:soluble lytic murein transglycosylase